MKLTNEELKRLLKTKSPKKIIYMHCSSIIDLTSKQIDRLIKLKEEKR